MKFQLLLTFSILSSALGQFDPHFIGNRQGIVHLFEWKWKDIAEECEEFLGPKGFGGVQVSPVNENVVIAGRPWFERYQPISYKLETRSGNESDFVDMVTRCKNVGVRIYVDVIANHMAATQSTSPAIGTGGSEADPSNRSYSVVPYTADDFHATCLITDYNNATNVRNCELVGLPDLNQRRLNVRARIIEFLDHLVDLGVAGFRMDACKHMDPEDLRIIFGSVKSLSTENGFKKNAQPFIVQEVIDVGNEGVRRQEYISLGTVTEFTYSTQIGMVFRKIDRNLSAIQQWGQDSGFLPSKYSFVFVSNHDNQRGHGSGGAMILTFKDRHLFTKASFLMLAHPHGGNHPRLMSSYYFNDPGQGPPQDSSGNIISRGIDSTGNCTNGWICEHRWPQIANMIKFRAVTDKTEVNSFTNIAKNQISFCRGNKGFVVINNSETSLNATLTACVPDGVYCDVISGDLVDEQCTGKAVVVKNGKANIQLPIISDGLLAIHVDARPTLCSCSMHDEL